MQRTKKKKEVKHIGTYTHFYENKIIKKQQYCLY